jgi:hypothetical protein
MNLINQITKSDKNCNTLQDIEEKTLVKDLKIFVMELKEIAE